MSVFCNKTTRLKSSERTFQCDLFTCLLSQNKRIPFSEYISLLQIVNSRKSPCRQPILDKRNKTKKVYVSTIFSVIF